MTFTPDDIWSDYVCLQTPMLIKRLTAASVIVLFSVYLLSGCGQNPESILGNSSTSNSLDGNSIFYQVHGEGEPGILFVHCWTCNHTFWQAQVEHFFKIPSGHSLGSGPVTACLPKTVNNIQWQHLLRMSLR